MQFLSTTAILALMAALPAAVTAEAICQGYLTDPSDIAACADQLTARAGESCSVKRGTDTVFCQIGTARIVGVGVGSPNGVETSSDW
jgi:hypothetical protein